MFPYLCCFIRSFHPTHNEVIIDVFHIELQMVWMKNQILGQSTLVDVSIPIEKAKEVFKKILSINNSEF